MRTRDLLTVAALSLFAIAPGYAQTAAPSTGAKPPSAATAVAPASQAALIDLNSASKADLRY